jgi:hypothetical protein
MYIFLFGPVMVFIDCELSRWVYSPLVIVGETFGLKSAMSGYLDFWYRFVPVETYYVPKDYLPPPSVSE